MKQIYILLAVLCFAFKVSTGNAQCECNTCDYVISPTSTDFYLLASEIKAAMQVSDLSGKKICIKGGTHVYPAIAFIGIEGSLNNPITITNCEGQATINGGESQPLRIWDSKYVRLVGNSCDGIKYGIHAFGDGNMVEIKAVNNKITDFEVAFINIGPDAELGGSAGLKIIDEPGCDQDTLQPRSNPGRWIMRNINVHDNYIHNVATEGMYIGKGDEAYGGKPITCGGVTKTTSSPSLQHVRIYNNIVDYIGWDGIQLKDADLDVKVYRNTITNYGVVKSLAQNEGLHLGSGVVGDVYENIVNTGTGNGFQYMGAGNLNFYNNLIINSGEAGLWAFGKFFELSSNDSYIRIVNNTIVKTGTEPHDRKEGILWQNYGDVKNMILQNNIIAEVPGTRAFVVADPVFDIVDHNDTVRDASALKFVHYEEATAADFLEKNDFHLKNDTSTAVDAGTNVSGYGTGYTKDFDGQNRNFNNAYDIGAFEYHGIVEQDSTWAVFINAGGDDFVSGETNWLRDKPANPHPAYNTSYTSFNTGSTSTFSGTNATDAPAQILGSYRYTNGTSNRIIKYDIPVIQPGATYRVKLYFARRNTDAYGAGTRRFNILIEGAVRYTDYDVYTNAASVADSLQYFITVQDGVLNLSFEGIGSAHAQVNAIAVEKYSPPPPPAGEDFALAINAGGDAFVEDDIEWARDKQTTPHQYYDTTFISYNTGSFSTFSGTNDLEAPEQVLGSYRYTSGSSNRTLRYNVPVPEAGDYQVKLYFAKRNTDTYGLNVRRFDIKLEGNTEASAYDVADRVAAGVLEQVFVTNVTDGFVEIKLVGVGSAHAQVNAIKIDGPIAGTASLASQPVAEEISEMKQRTGYAVYPNPVENKLLIHFPKAAEYRVRIFDAFNTIVFDQMYSGDAIQPREIDTSTLPADGIYLLKIESEKKTHTFRLLKN